MKTNVFDFNRIVLLFQRYFIERSRSEVIYWGIMAIVFMFIRNQPPAIFTLIFIAGVFYAARFFKEIHHSGNGVAYFMIPATQLEKLTVSIVLTSLYYYVMMIIVYVIGNFVGTYLENMLTIITYTQHHQDIGIGLGHSSLQWKLFEGPGIFPKAMFEIIKSDIETIRNVYWIFPVFLINQSLFLLGSIYFKRNQAFKTFFTVVLLFIFLLIVSFIEIRLFFGTDKVVINMANEDQFKDWEIWLNFFAIPAKILYYLLPLFFWVVSYFRLTEKQV